MIAAYRSLALGAACVTALYGCGSSSHSSESGGSAAAAGTGAAGSDAGAGFTSAPASLDGSHDTVVATPQSNLVSVEVGMQQTVSITFTSSDGRTITGFALSTGKDAALPAGWSGASAFGCDALSTGSSCVLNLTYAPAQYETGRTLTLDYVYIDNATDPVINGTMTLAFQATTNDNVVAALSSVGQVNATVGGSQILTATFTTDDGHPAAALNVSSDPSTLPPGWSGPAQGACATVSAGTACQLAWVYSPMAPGSGTLTVAYSFDDDSGTPKTSSFNVPYAATANDNVVYPAVSPITLAAGASQVLTVIFNTDDGFQATNLLMDLSTLPAGWTSAAGAFTCATISTGGSCALSLTYAPSGALATSTLTLPYSYDDNAGTAKSGSLIIVYTSTQ